MMYLNLTEKVDKKELKAMIEELKNSNRAEKIKDEKLPNLGDIEKIGFMVDKTPKIKELPKNLNKRERVKKMLEVANRAKKYFGMRDSNRELSPADIRDIDDKAESFAVMLLDLRFSGGFAAKDDFGNVVFKNKFGNLVSK